ncbi:MAG: dynamin family protein [Pseudomonadota bacterium]
MSPSPQTIGQLHRTAADHLCQAFDQLSAVCPPEFAERVSDERAEVADWRARIAIVGQVKAGKSSLLSTVIEKPHFLPSEVNPWTAVVTNLHFAHPRDPTSGGIFHFYDETAWARIVEGDPDTRALAEDLLPGFAVDVLSQQVESMRRRARNRLGQFYELLLGKSHSYEIVTRETLERYVCAGPERDPEAALSGPAGRYADLTERADIYLPPGPFSAASVLTDTPGINDPFMVRDAYTCRSLGQSDIFIMALSAHQALTDVDLALLRMLALRQDNEIIVFINRIDELADPKANSQTVMDSVQSRLNEAMPDREIRLFAGSARWAELALQPEAEPKAFEAELARPGLRTWLDAQPGESDRERMLHLSGLPVVHEALSEIIDEGIGRDFRERSARSLLVTLDACTARLKSRDQQSDLSAAPPSDSRSSREIWEQTMLDHRQEIADALANVIVSLRRELEQQLRAFVDGKCNELVDIIEQGDVDGRFEFDALALRRSLEDTFMASYAASRARLDAKLTALRQQASQTALSLVGDLGLGPDLPDLPGREVTPLFATPSTQLTLELTSKKSWAFWRRASWDQAGNLDRLARMIRSEFYPSIEHFLELAQQELAKRGNVALRDIDQVCQAALTAREAGGLAHIQSNPAERRRGQDETLADLKAIRAKIAALYPAPMAEPVSASGAS